MPSFSANPTYFIIIRFEVSFLQLLNQKSRLKSSIVRVNQLKNGWPRPHVLRLSCAEVLV